MSVNLADNVLIVYISLIIEKHLYKKVIFALSALSH